MSGILFCTPAYGNMVTAAFLRSALKFSLECPHIAFDWLIPEKNDSLIQRARNLCVRRFMDTGFTHLMFVDADIEFSSQDVANVWNLEADIAGGIYPMKRKDKDWYAAWVDGRLVTELGEEPVECDYLGTGFLMIKREVFQAFREKWPEREHAEGEYEDMFAWFHPRVGDDGSGPFYLSEDYAFCHDARELGFKIIADPTVKLLHHGTYAFGS